MFRVFSTKLERVVLKWLDRYLLCPNISFLTKSLQEKRCIEEKHLRNLMDYSLKFQHIFLFKYV